MKTTELRVFVGANLYAEVPVCRLRLEPDPPDETVDAPIPAILLQRGLRLFPWFRQVLVEMSDTGLEGAHVGHLVMGLVEVAAADLEWRLSYKSIVRNPETGGLDLIFSYEGQSVAAATVNYVLRILQRLNATSEVEIENLPTTLSREHRAFVEKTAPRCWKIDTRYLVAAARYRDIPVQVMDMDMDVLIFGHGRNQQRMCKKTTALTGWGAFQFAKNKFLANRELGRVGLPVPEQRVISDRDAISRAARQLGFPLVVKPAATDLGVGITVGINDEESLAAAFEQAFDHAPSVVLERFLEGNEYRLLVIDGKMVAAAQRVPAHVIGDGRHTVKELVDRLNRDPRRGIGKQSTATRVVLDQEAEKVLTGAGYGIDDIPSSGKRVFLRNTSNLSRGGTSIDMTGQIHPDNEAAAVLAAQVIGLDIAGVDFITPDIARSWKEVGGGICEINASPGLRMHFSPGEGEPRDVASPILKMLYPPGRSSRIPVAVVTGSNGKTTTTRMSAHILHQAGACVGLTCTDGVYVDREKIRTGDLSGGPAAQRLLIDPRIDAAVLEIARGAILKWGTGIDSCDVTAVTNIAEEHLGELGIQTRDDMARVKGLLVELARKMVILGADDPLTAGLAQRSRAERLCYVSIAEDNTLVAEHIASGWPALRLEQVKGDPWIVLYDKGVGLQLMQVSELPASLGGIATYNIENAMFAAAVAYGLGQEPEFIARSLRTFKCDHDQNPGRMNFIDGLPFNVIVDYCHNRHGLAAVGPVIDRPDISRRILVYSMPGNRRETDFKQAMQVAAEHFDEFHLYPVADSYLRGRSKAEIIHLLAQGLQDAGVSGKTIVEHESQDEALDKVLAAAQKGDLIFVATLAHESAWQQIRAHVSAK